MYLIKKMPQKIGLESFRRYGNALVKSKCGPDLLATKIFPDFKEITESFGAFHAIRKTMEKFAIKYNDDKVWCIVIGDGCTPRTGALLAFKTNWNVISVDPRLRKVGQNPVYNRITINKLTLIAKKFQDITFDSQIKKAIYVLVHSHYSVKSLVDRIGEGLAPKAQFIVSIPCCVADGVKPTHTHTDPGILSDKNVVNVYYKMFKDGGFLVQ